MGFVVLRRTIVSSSSEAYGKTLVAFLPRDHPLGQEYESPCIFGSMEKLSRGGLVCAKQVFKKRIHAEGAENGLEFMILRPFNWIDQRMELTPSIGYPWEGVPRVLACFESCWAPTCQACGRQLIAENTYINDAIEAVLFINRENLAWANGHIFNVWNPRNEVPIKQLAEMIAGVSHYLL